tara:strand:+ start:1854 stop:2378 length:525 start_codon:yes stop_codon:yes gene_type:complete
VQKASDYRKLSPGFNRAEAIAALVQPDGDEKKKLIAKVRFAIGMMECLSDFTRMRSPSWPAMIRNEQEVRDAFDPPKDDMKKRVRGYWGRHRFDVTRCEGENEGRLGTLCWARDVFIETGDGASVSLLAALDRHLRAEFNVAPSEIPSDMLERVKWCRDKTRDHSALPRGLRTL